MRCELHGTQQVHAACHRRISYATTVARRLRRARSMIEDFECSDRARLIASAFAGALLMFVVGCSSSSDTPASSGGAGGSGGSSSSGSSGKGGSSATAGMEGDTVCTSDASPGDVVDVPAGSFQMGCNSEVDDQCSDDENPQHTVKLSAFSIDVTEVTQDQYAACFAAGACTAPNCPWDCSHTDYPATCVNWDQAQTFCAWAGKRLPTEAEWEKAARGTDDLIYPWGNDDPDCTLANMSGCGDVAMPVGSLPDGASPYGALDMAGNVVELVEDFYDADYYATSPTDDPTGPATGSRYGGRGGGFKSEALWQRTSKRDWYDPDDQGESLGFRCAE
jgi:formylglycine-generating enzyme